MVPDEGERLRKIDNKSQQFQISGAPSENNSNTEKSKTNKTIENRVEPRLRQDIDDFDGFNNSDDDEEIIDAGDGDSNVSNKQMHHIEEMDDEDESKQFLDAY